MVAEMQGVNCMQTSGKGEEVDPIFIPAVS